jgi:hypothetical protein
MATTKLSDSGTLGNKYENLSADNNYMETIASSLVGAGGVSSITFSNIPQGYKHLQIRVLSRSSTAGTQVFLYPQYNGDTGNNYTIHYLQGSGSSAAATAYTPTAGNFAMDTPAASANANVFGGSVIDILDYTNTSKYKTMRSLTGYDNNGSGFIDFMSGLWLNTAPITSITISGGTIAQYSRFSLYGIKG